MPDTSKTLSHVCDSRSQGFSLRLQLRQVPRCERQLAGAAGLAEGCRDAGARGQLDNRLQRGVRTVEATSCSPQAGCDGRCGFGELLHSLCLGASWGQCRGSGRGHATRTSLPLLHEEESSQRPRDDQHIKSPPKRNLFNFGANPPWKIPPSGSVQALQRPLGSLLLGSYPICLGQSQLWLKDKPE